MKRIALLTLCAVLCGIVAFAQNRQTKNVGSFTKISFRFPGKLYLKQGSPQKVEVEGDKDVLAELEVKVEGSKLIIGKEGKWMDWNWSNDDKIIAYVTVPSLEGVSVSGSGDVIGENKFNADDMDLNVSGSGSLSLDVDATGDMSADVSGSGGIDVKGKCKSFKSDISGSGKVEMAMIIAGEAEFNLSGSGKVEASGSADVVDAEISGSGKVLAADLQTNRCDVRISGSGDVEINVKNELDATISGSGTVSYKGSPNKINSNASGSGKVSKM